LCRLLSPYTINEKSLGMNLYWARSSVQLVKKISPYSFVMAVNLEPIYAIVRALLIWPESETMSEGFYFGAGIVALTIFLSGYF